MYWINKKNEPGWEPKFLEDDWGKYEVAMQILYPQSWQVKMHYIESLIRRKRTSVSDKSESVIKLLSIIRGSYKHELENLFSGISQMKRFELATKRLSKISMGVFINTSIKKESFMDIWSNPDVYKVLDWDITAPFDSDKNEYIAEKAKYSISYEQFRKAKASKEPASQLFSLKIYEYDKKRSDSIILRKDGDRYYFFDRNIERIKNYPGIEIIAGNIVRLTAVNFDLKPLK